MENSNSHPTKKLRSTRPNSMAARCFFIFFVRFCLYICN
jgi:hypothetical protein